MDSRFERFILLPALALLFVVLGWAPTADRVTWFLENLPIVIGLPILIATYPRFAFTRMAYALLFLHAVVLMVGGHYTYAEVPVGNWARDTFGLARNHYDRVGHFVQGFVPAIIARELLLRTSPLRHGRWLFAVVTMSCVAVSAFYEFFEWWVAAATGESATAFLGTQGDQWDTQWDMFLATLGAISSQLMLAGWHDRQLART